MSFTSDFSSCFFHVVQGWCKHDFGTHSPFPLCFLCCTIPLSSVPETALASGLFPRSHLSFAFSIRRRVDTHRQAPLIHEEVFFSHQK